MTRALPRIGLTAFDVLMIAGIALIPIMAWRGIRLAEWGLLPVLLVPLVWRQMVPDRTDWWTIGLFAQYGILVAVNILIYARLAPEADAGDKLGLYLGAPVLLLLLVMRLRMTRDVARIWRIVAPVVVVASVGMLGWEHFTTPEPDNCRVGFLAKFVLFPPLGLTVLALASYAGWDRMAGWERALRHVTLALVIVATVAFSGARAVLLAQALTVPVLALLLGMGEPLRRQVRIVAVLGVTAFAGLAAGLVLDLRAGCNFAGRLVAIGETVTQLDEAGDIARERFSDRLEAKDPSGQETAPEMVPADKAPAEASSVEETRVKEAPAESAAEKHARKKIDRQNRRVGSVYIRPLLWADALDRIREAPLRGHGMLNESELVVGDYPHYHEQYLSWLVWGGIPMLVSGLVMLFAPLATFGIRRSRDGAVLALAMIGPLAVSFLAGSYLLHTVMVLGHVMTLALAYAMARESAAKKWRGGDEADPSRDMGPRMTGQEDSPREHSAP